MSDTTITPEAVTEENEYSTEDVYSISTSFKELMWHYRDKETELKRVIAEMALSCDQFNHPYKPAEIAAALAEQMVSVNWEKELTRIAHVNALRALDVEFP